MQRFRWTVHHQSAATLSPPVLVMMGSAAAPPKSQSQRQLVPQLRLLYAHLLAWSIWAQCRQNVPANSFDQSRARRERAPSDKPCPVGKVTAAMCKQWRKAPKVPQYGFAATFVVLVSGLWIVRTTEARISVLSKSYPCLLLLPFFLVRGFKNQRLLIIRKGRQKGAQGIKAVSFCCPHPIWVCQLDS